MRHFDRMEPAGEPWPAPPPPLGRSERQPRHSRPRRRGWLSWLALAAGLGALLAVGIAAFSIRAYARDQATAPGRVLQRYCSALLAHNYASAYALLDRSAQGAQTQAQFAADARLHDTVDGRVVACTGGQTASGWQYDLSFLLSPPAGVALRTTVTRARLGARQGMVTIDRQSSAWRVQTIDAELQGTPLGPLQVADHFCRALAAGNYASAFGDLSAHQTAVERSPANFAAEAARPEGVGYADCAPDYRTYSVKGGAAMLGLTVDLRVATPSGATVVSLPASATFVLERGSWKLDGLDVTAPGSSSSDEYLAPP
jgi:hypothetical protein